MFGFTWVQSFVVTATYFRLKGTIFFIFKLSVLTVLETRNP